MNTDASVAPIIIFLVVILLVGLMFGLFSAVLAPGILEAKSDGSWTSIDWIMENWWAVFVPVVIFLGLISWVILRGQRGPDFV